MTDRKTNIVFSNLIQQLYGQNDFYRIKKRHSIARLKKYYLKILDTFKISLNETLSIADRTQLEALNVIIEVGQRNIKSANNFEFIDNYFIEVQTKLIFQLIGELPNRWTQKNVPNRKEFWKLNDFRQIQYVQNGQQKERMIFHILQSKYSDRFPDFMEFIDKIYWTECNHDLATLISWFKENHTDIYYEII